MENPASWGKLERAINSAILDHAKSIQEGVVGLSLVMTIANKLREDGLVATDRLTSKP